MAGETTLVNIKLFTGLCMFFVMMGLVSATDRYADSFTCEADNCGLFIDNANMHDSDWDTSGYVPAELWGAVHTYNSFNYQSGYLNGVNLTTKYSTLNESDYIELSCWNYNTQSYTSFYDSIKPDYLTPDMTIYNGGKETADSFSYTMTEGGRNSAPASLNDGSWTTLSGLDNGTINIYSNYTNIPSDASNITAYYKVIQYTLGGTITIYCYNFSSSVYSQIDFQTSGGSSPISKIIPAECITLNGNNKNVFMEYSTWGSDTSHGENFYEENLTWKAPGYDYNTIDDTEDWFNYTISGWAASVNLGNINDGNWTNYGQVSNGAANSQLIIYENYTTPSNVIGANNIIRVGKYGVQTGQVNVSYWNITSNSYVQIDYHTLPISTTNYTISIPIDGIGSTIGMRYVLTATGTAGATKGINFYESELAYAINKSHYNNTVISETRIDSIPSVCLSNNKSINISVGYFSGNNAVSLYEQSISYKEAVGSIPTATTFLTTYGSTNLNEVSDYTNVSNLVLAKSVAKLKWLNNVNISGKDLDNAVSIGAKFVSIDAASVPSLNTTANVTLNISGTDVSCSNFKLYYAPTYQTTASGIISGGSIVATQTNLNSNCTDPTKCQDLICSNGIVTFKAMHFDGFAMGPGVLGLEVNATVQILNVAPTITSITPPSPVSLIAASTQTAHVFFNATDNNGVADFNDSSAYVSASKGGETTRTGSCSVVSSGDIWRVYDCTLTFYYYDGAGSWSLDASVTDKGLNTAHNTSSSLTIDSLDSITLTVNSIDFGSSGSGSNDVPGTIEVINNTGNTIYPAIALKGYDLESGLNNLNISNFCANDINDANTGCDTLINDTDVTVTDATLSKGAVATSSIYSFVDIPVNLPSGIYTSITNWVFTTS